MLHKVLAGLDVVWSCGRLAPVQSGIWAMNTLEPRVGAVRSCIAVSESFDVFNRFAAALAKSQDRRASSGVFAFGRPQCGTSVVEARDTLHTSEPEQGRWAESRAGWCTNSLGNANATGGSMLGNVASEAKRGAVTVGLRFAQGFTSWGFCS